jgi:hypothetical protein
MKVGDLVRYKTRTNSGSWGIIVSSNWSGTTPVWLVEWMNGVRSAYPQKYLEVA